MRSIIKAADWTLGQETGEGSPEAGFFAVYLACDAESQPTDNDRLPVEIWALRHTGLNPDHRQFKASAETFWSVTPAEGNPYRESDAQVA